MTALWLLTLLVVSPTQLGDEFPLPAPLSALRERDQPAVIALGRSLFFDKRLSRTREISCATCHDPRQGFSNGQPTAKGVANRTGRRNVPGLVNLGYQQRFFWDGRASSLEEQALGPIQNPDEMDLKLSDLLARLDEDATYRQQFREAFAGPASAERVGLALAAYERTLVSRDTPFDRFLQGDQMSLSESARRGMRLFFGQGRCAACHKGANLTDDAFHNIGTASPDDKGREEITENKRDRGAFKTPSLREVAHTAPYMHHGRMTTLKQVVEHYNFGGVGQSESVGERDELLAVLYLNETQVEDLIAFLQSGLSTPPKLPRPR
jgi:cytochrome c peroxidase